MDYEIRPEPTETERAAVVAALGELDEERPHAYLSAWRRDGIEPDEEGYEATARPRSSRGLPRFWDVA